MLDIKQKIKQSLERIDEATIPYFKELEGSTKQRIHNKGLDSDGNIIGKKSKRGGRYSPGYEKKKEKIVGKPNLYPINLQLSGDLFRSFTVGTQSGKVVLEFQDQFNSNKAAFNENNFNTEIYRPSQDQLDDAEEVLILGIESILTDEFSK